ncbi:deoxyribodipyrimidine photo-lyase, partial [Bradyrhizobium sp. NBAIM08]|uniref:deoxyribodipyrimidine photo-lyase n=1 Tax=Bradyrhizobium sp. NBAIM08 TaxID=2793815 RepID=UPI001CD6E02D|nr:deoxyribodipyrimidine photo-lyase [Bradyrhizobium sp. NBAIM08]
MKAAVVLFNRDLRVHDNPALASAARCEQVVPLFVLDDAILGSRFAAPNRLAFLLDSLRDLDESLGDRGARLVIRRGDPVKEAIGVAKDAGATEIHVSADYSAFARARERRLSEACEHERLELQIHPGVTVVPPGDLTP